MSDEQILALVLAHAGQREDGKKTLACKQAFAIAEENAGAKLSAIGRVCTENGVKIVGCQLGCFA